VHRARHVDDDADERGVGDVELISGETDTAEQDGLVQVGDEGALGRRVGEGAADQVSRVVTAGGG
jgi:hypothetical protein